jgi:UDP-N-acetylmuramyl pentapeptide synthase
MSGEKVAFFNDNFEAVDFLKGKIGTGDTILVKGSRGMKMETIVEGLMG